MRFFHFIILGGILAISIWTLQIRQSIYLITEVNNIRLDGITVRQAKMVNEILNGCRNDNDLQILKVVKNYVNGDKK